MARRRSAKQRAASRRNLAKARRARSGDTLFGLATRMAISTTASTLSGGYAKPISDFIEGKGTPKQIRGRRRAKAIKRAARGKK